APSDSPSPQRTSCSDVYKVAVHGLHRTGCGSHYSVATSLTRPIEWPIELLCHIPQLYIGPRSLLQETCRPAPSTLAPPLPWQNSLRPSPTSGERTDRDHSIQPGAANYKRRAVGRVRGCRYESGPSAALPAPALPAQTRSARPGSRSLC